MSTGKEDVQKTQRSVFVGNIPYEATEEQLKEIFEQVGPVVSFRIVYDRESGKPKGYGFCEYQDTETAKSAMRNLNDHDFHGRSLRVGHAAGETSNAEKAVSQAITGPPEEPMYGDAVEPEKAPEAISRAVASLPPEQMFELMKQMKMCIQNNPNEARNMLLQNPQLAYALLQAQIVMKIVDPQVALAMLHRQSEQIPPLMPTSSEESAATTKSAEATTATPVAPTAAAVLSAATQPTPAVQPPQPKLQDVDHRQHIPNIPLNQALPATQTPTMPPGQLHTGPPASSPMLQPQQQHTPMQSMPQSASMGPMGGSHNQPPATAKPGMGGPAGPGPAPPRSGLLGDRPGAPGQFDRNRGPGFMDNRGGPPQHNPGMAGGPGFQGGGPGPGGRPDPRDPRSGRMGPGGPIPGLGGPGPRPAGPGPNMPASRPPNSAAPANPAAAGSAITSQDQEKAQLIMQVLQLSDEQIAMLPPDQRHSILILKEQIAKSTNP